MVKAFFGIGQDLTYSGPKIEPYLCSPLHLLFQETLSIHIQLSMKGRKKRKKKERMKEIFFFFSLMGMWHRPTGLHLRAGQGATAGPREGGGRRQTAQDKPGSSTPQFPYEETKMLPPRLER